MVNWVWLALAFVLGGLFSFVIIGLLAAAKNGDADA